MCGCSADEAGAGATGSSSGGGGVGGPLLEALRQARALACCQQPGQRGPSAHGCGASMLAPASASAAPAPAPLRHILVLPAAPAATGGDKTAAAGSPRPDLLSAATKAAEGCRLVVVGLGAGGGPPTLAESSAAAAAATAEQACRSWAAQCRSWNAALEGLASVQHVTRVPAGDGTPEELRAAVALALTSA